MVNMPEIYIYFYGWKVVKERFLNIIDFVRFEVFTAVTMKNAVFWDVAPCRSCVNRRFGGTYRLRLQGRKSASEEPA
jgi:hypothetical protein